MLKKYANKVRIIHESKGQHIGKAEYLRGLVSVHERPIIAGVRLSLASEYWYFPLPTEVL